MKKLIYISVCLLFFATPALSEDAPIKEPTRYHRYLPIPINRYCKDKVELADYIDLNFRVTQRECTDEALKKNPKPCKDGCMNFFRLFREYAMYFNVCYIIDELKLKFDAEDLIACKTIQTLCIRDSKITDEMLPPSCKKEEIYGKVGEPSSIADEIAKQDKPNLISICNDVIPYQCLRTIIKFELDKKNRKSNIEE